MRRFIEDDAFGGAWRNHKMRLFAIALISMIAPLAVTPAEAVFVPDAEATPSSVQARRAQTAGKEMTLAWWFRPSCWRRRVPNCAYGGAYVSGYDNCGAVWSCGQSYIPNSQPPGYPSYPTVPQPAPQPQYPADSNPFNPPEYSE